jgi:hypothetical protein
VKRIGVIAAAGLAAALFLGGCGSDPPATGQPPTTAGSPQPSGSAAATPTPSASALIEFTVDGAGPYELGETLTALQSGAGLEEVTASKDVCPGNTTARGTGVWRDVHLSFRNDGELYMLVNRSPNIPTPSGAWLGTSLAELKTIYAAVRGQELRNGPATAYLVTTLSGRGILFDLGQDNKVVAMVASEADYLRNSYQGGTDFC